MSRWLKIKIEFPKLIVFCFTRVSHITSHFNKHVLLHKIHIYRVLAAHRKTAAQDTPPFPNDQHLHHSNATHSSQSCSSGQLDSGRRPTRDRPAWLTAYSLTHILRGLAHLALLRWAETISAFSLLHASQSRAVMYCFLLWPLKPQFQTLLLTQIL